MTEAQNEFVVHQEPIWRERANFIINAPMLEKDLPKRYEQLYTRKLGDGRFEICCIPFFLFDVALGDVVTTSPRDGRTYVFEKVVQPSGRWVFRVWFGESFYPREEVASELKSLGSLIEWASQNLLAVDAADEEHSKLVANFLWQREKAEQLIYETGRT